MIQFANDRWNVVIRDCRIDSTGNASVAVDAGEGATGLRVEAGNVFAADEGDTSISAVNPVNLHVEANTFGGAGEASTAVELNGAVGGATVTDNRFRWYQVALSVANGNGAAVTVEDNDFVECGTGVLFGDSGGPGELHSAAVYGNLFYENDTGLLVTPGDHVRADAVHVYRANWFVDNLVAVENTDTRALSAGELWRGDPQPGRGNWWGHMTGPSHVSNPGGRGDAAVGPVDFSPPLDAPAGLFRPCVDVRFGALDLPATIVPGDSLTLPVEVGNVGLGVGWASSPGRAVESSVIVWVPYMVFPAHGAASGRAGPSSTGAS